MKVQFGSMYIVYPDKWPKTPKPATWFADFVRREYRRTRKPVVMEIHRDELQAVCDAVGILDKDKKTRFTFDPNRTTIKQINKHLRDAWSVTYDWQPHKAMRKAGWMRCRFNPPGKTGDADLFTAQDRLDAYEDAERKRIVKHHRKPGGVPKKKTAQGETPEIFRSVFDKTFRETNSVSAGVRAVMEQPGCVWGCRTLHTHFSGSKKK